jgi:hypothetical protein
MMDLSKFFSYFNTNPSIGYSEKDMESFKNSPLYKIKVFERLIINGVAFKKSLVNFFNQADEDLDIGQVDLAGEFMMYHRAWFWISLLDWDNEEWVKDLKKASNEKLLTAIRLCIHYFEEQEEYEKCAFLKRIQDFVQNCLEVKD